MDFFVIATAIGVVLFIVSFFFDGEEIFGEAIIPPIAALFAFFGITGVITLSVGPIAPLLLGVFSAVVGVGAAVGTVILYKAAHRLGDGRHNDTPPVSALIGKKGNVIWWHEGSGEINLIVSGDITRVKATGPAHLAPSTEVFVVDTPPAQAVVVTASS